MYLLTNDSDQNKYKWTNPKFLIRQIILELTPPTGFVYIFNEDTLVNGLKNIPIQDIIPFYDNQSRMTQPYDEIQFIIMYYQDTLGFGKMLPQDNMDKTEYVYEESFAKNVAKNIITEAQKLNLIKKQ